jgi:hypothetical protein
VCLLFGNPAIEFGHGGGKSAVFKGCKLHPESKPFGV